MSDEKLPQEEIQSSNDETKVTPTTIGTETDSNNSEEIPSEENESETTISTENISSSEDSSSEEVLQDNKTETPPSLEKASEKAVNAEKKADVIEESDDSQEESGNLVGESLVEEKKTVEKMADEIPVVAEDDPKKDITPTTKGSDEEDEGEEEEEEVASSEDEEKDEEDAEQKDYSSLSGKELIAELEKLVKNKPVQEIKQDVEEIRNEFHSLFNEEMEQKKEEFLAEGGNIIDFQYTTPLKKEFNSIYFDYKEKRNNHYRTLKRDLQANLERRWELIEELKGLLSAEENINTTYKHFKEIQEKWHVAGAIPRDKYNTVWNTYHHHVENFYDFLHLNREFRDLDFKYNLDSKLKLIARAEELAQEENVDKAFRELQMLHKMWKEEIGPVAKEYRDEVWDKFSEATKVIHDRRQAQLQELEKTFQDNYEKKKQLVEEINKIAEEAKPSHQGWQNAIKTFQELREKYFAIGRVPRANNKEIWKIFKEATGNFNKQKNSFYKNQKKEQYENLQKKRELIKIAEDNKDSEDFEVTTALMKKIQNEWKGIGHVPRKDSDKLWKQFKKACNEYFDRLHAQKNEASKEEMVNFEAKEALIEKLSSFELTGNHKEDIKTIKEKIGAWKKLGRVPYNKRNIEQKFNKILDGLFAKLDLSKKETELIKFDNKLNTLVNREDDRKLQNEHFFISKKIDETRNEILQLENNLGFFHHVDENNPMVKEVHKNITRHKEQLEVWKAKLSKIKEIRED